MDRKLFLSYIQNLQTNNPDMIGFQNSMTKNSWQKPRSIVEMSGGGHVHQDAFDADDRRRQSVEDEEQARVDRILSSVEFANAVKEHHRDTMSDGGSFEPGFVIDQLNLGPISDNERYMLHSGIKDLLHDLGGPDENETEMQVSALQRQGKFLPKAP
jgi:hypothetical protein